MGAHDDSAVPVGLVGRQESIARMLALDGRGELTTGHARLVAAAAGVSLRTVWRWLEAARRGRAGRRERPRFTITPELHGRLAMWCGNAAAVHRELVAEARAAGEGSVPVPSLSTVHRAVRRDLNAGQRAALAGGEAARRQHDVHLRRPQQWRNACWEGDHKHVPVEVLLDGELVCPWVTWFIDCATNAITGAAVTPHRPSREAILAALRIALTRDGTGGRYGPVGGLPALVRIDRGADFLSRTVGAALGALAVPVYPLPAYQPHRKGTVENLNRCAQRMLFASLPRYTSQPSDDTARSWDPAKDHTEPLPFTAFVQILLDWVAWWNTEHPSQALQGRTPLQAWESDPTPVDDVDPQQLRAFTLEGNAVRVVTTSGVRWHKRYYIADWMNGRAGEQLRVRVRYLPHHEHEIECFDAASGAYLGPAHLADEATAEQRAALRRSRAAEQRRLTRALAAAARARRERYAAVTSAEPPKRLGAVTAGEAREELEETSREELAALALPDLVPPPPPPAHWRTPPGMSFAEPACPPEPASQQDLETRPRRRLPVRGRKFSCHGSESMLSAASAKAFADGVLREARLVSIQFWVRL